MADNPQNFSPVTLSTLGKDASTINGIASVVGVSALYIAAPIAREMTATENPTLARILAAPLKDSVVNYQQEIVGTGITVTVHLIDPARLA